MTLLLPKDLNLESIELSPRIYTERLVAPIEAGTVLGRAEILIGGESYGQVNLVNAMKVELSKKEFMTQRVHQTFSSPWIIFLIVLLLVIAIGYLTLVLRYRAQRRKYLRRKREMAARRAARERSAASTLSAESTQRLTAIVDEELHIREQKKER